MELNDLDITTYQDIVNYFKDNTDEKKVISIENSISLEKILIANTFFSKNKDYKFILSIDFDDNISKNDIKYFDIFNYLTEIENITIIISGSERLNDIAQLSIIKNIKSFSLNGFYKKTISLKEIEKYEELEEIELDWGLNKSQQKIINNFKKLKKLNVKIIDLSSFDTKEKMKQLTINHSIKNHLKIKDRFPNLKYLSLNKCQDIKDFIFLDDLDLEELSLNYMPQLVEFPNLKNNNKIKKIELSEARNLSNINNILNFTNLEKLSITRIKNLKAKDFEIFSKLKRLNTLYADFQDNNEREKFENLAKSNNWINSTIDW